ncbi:gamma-aminobutyric acid type B receptor subunit 2-like [Mya arenaria]|uniref:gamma-aminobutyric acid type B receptor subunit 2-like n=1 Tax=Mya arenaria TaxID=6604 RepID=UPI0022E07D8E|nr:gamma-aminobutyric acid type B receptor subunit 2-like [Mya arenaria]
MGHQKLVGISGRVSYAQGGADPDKSVIIQRVQGGKRVKVGIYKTHLDPQRIEWEPGALQWKDGNVPRDSTFVTHVEVVLPAEVYVTMCTLAALGILLAVCLFAFNVYFRNNKIVKLSSPNINNVLLLGCVLCYSTVFIKTTETTTGILCKSRVIGFCIGFTTTFGALFTKTWRVYRIFTNKRLLKRTIKDYQLLAVIAGLVMFVMCIVVAWEIVGPHVMVVKYLENKIFKLGHDEEVYPFVRMCISEYSIYFSWIVYVVEGALLSFGAFLAWETRHVKIQALNDSHQIGLCLYNVVILSAVGLTLSLLLDDNVVMLYGINSGCILIGTTVTQMVVFIPKIHAVYARIDVTSDPVGGPGQSGTDRCGASNKGTGTTASRSTTQPD